MLFQSRGRERETGKVYFRGVANNIANQSYIFTDIPSFDIDGLISIYHKR